MTPIIWTGDLPIIGPFTFTAYFTMITVGFILAIPLMWREAKRLNINPDRIMDLCLWTIITSIAGSRVLHVVADGHLMEYINYCIDPAAIRLTDIVPAFCTSDGQCGRPFLCNEAAGYCHPPQDCLRALKIWQGGLVYYGGFLGAVSFAIFYTRRHKLPLWRVSDLAGYGVPLGIAWGRLGCFLNGCCFGTTTKGALGVVFPKNSVVWQHQLEAGLVQASAHAPLAVHSTQIYSALGNLSIFFICYFWIRPRRRFDGQVFWWFVVLKAVSRFLIEFLRDDDRGAIMGVISTSQAISVGLLLVAAIMLRRCRRMAATMS